MSIWRHTTLTAGAFRLQRDESRVGPSSASLRQRLRLSRSFLWKPSLLAPKTSPRWCVRFSPVVAVPPRKAPRCRSCWPWQLRGSATSHETLALPNQRPGSLHPNAPREALLSCRPCSKEQLKRDPLDRMELHGRSAGATPAYPPYACSSTTSRSVSE